MLRILGLIYDVECLDLYALGILMILMMPKVLQHVEQLPVYHTLTNGIICNNLASFTNLTMRSAVFGSTSCTCDELKLT